MKIYIMNYGGMPKEYSDIKKAKIVVLPIPYDGTSTWIKGADKGPAAILEASANMELFDIETNSEVYRQGIYTAPAVTESKSPEKMAEVSYQTAKKIVDNDKFLVTLGGEHSVSYGPIRAYAEKYKNLTILQLDAHSDLRQSYEGSKHNHACIMARAKELAHIVQVGIRSQDVSEIKYVDANTIFYAERIRKIKNWQQKVVSCLTENVYITIDLDVFDPSIMPSTGTPEPGGLLWYEVIDLLKLVTEKTNVVGFDVVELCPNKINKAPDFLASKLIYKILSFCFEK